MKKFPDVLKPGLLLVVASFWVSSCVNAETDEWASLEHTDGQSLFVEKCGMCHRESGMGTGILGRRMSPELALLENRDDLQAVYINTVVRSGFNTMFPISRGEVSNEQLDKIALYLTDKEK